VAYGNAGLLFVSSHPGGGASTWTARHIDGSAQLQAVSCPSRTLCAAYDEDGALLVSRHPLKGASTWRRLTVDRGLEGLTCASSSLCVGVDGAGNVIASTRPGRPGSWRRFPAGDDSPTYECVHYQEPGVCAERSLSDLSCPSARLCVALDQAGNIALSTDPAVEPSTWHVVYAEAPDSPSGMDRLRCATERFCYGTDNWGNFVASTHPAQGQSAWRATGLGTAGAQNGPDASLDHFIGEVSCVSRSACIAASSRGQVLAAANPGARVPEWKRAGLSGVPSITCAGHGWCFAVDGRGRVFSAQEPASRPRIWRRAFTDSSVRDTASLEVATSFSCPSAKVCVAVDARGRVVTGRAPRRG
jgi:hypothetical protein